MYLEGSNLGEPVPFPLYLEQWQDKIGWQVLAPCVDLAPSDVVRLKPAKSLIVEERFENPLPSVCKVRNIRFQGKFRFRLDYFLSEKAARRHEENFFSSSQGPNRLAVSEPFEIPEPKK